MENLYTPNCIRTNSGIYFNILEPTLDMIDINDIAHALSHQCRFGGHIQKFYSVAQHCVMAATYVPPPLKRATLLHDASEAYLLDIPKPIKPHLNNYEELEDKLMRLIAEKFKFQYPLTDEVKSIDKQMLEMEWRFLMLQEPHPDTFDYWKPKLAKKEFLAMFNMVR